MKSRFKEIASNPIFQSAIVGALVTLLLVFIWDAPIKKYNIKVDPFARATNSETLWFVDDFNGDGNSERIRCKNGYNSESLDVVYYDKDGNLTNDYHIPGSAWNYRLEPAVFDINKDGLKELLFFTVRNDSIFFNALNLVEFTLTISEKYFNTFERKRDNYAYISQFIAFGDFNGDNTDELFFCFDAGFGLYPRGVFKMEFPSLTISASPTEHMLIRSITIYDFNKDGTPEIVTQTAAPDNSTNKNKYSDTCSYITVLNYDLSFLFEPIPMKGRYSSVITSPSYNKDSLLYALHLSRSNSKEPIKLMTLDYTGNIVKQKKWHNIQNPENLNLSLKNINNTPYLIVNRIGRFKLTKELDQFPVKFSTRINNVTNSPLCIDLNNDGVDELVFSNAKDEITILNEKSNDRIKFDSPFKIKNSIHIYPFLKNSKTIKYAVTTIGGILFLEYHKNNYYYLLWLIYILVFLVTTGTISFILNFQKKSIEKKWATEQQLSELQFNSVKNQLNPHFLFNALNSVAFMINEGKKDEAYDFLAINARMIRRVMNDAKEIKRPLKDEIEFTKDYVRIQEHRFKDRFISEFKIHPDVDLKLEVPKMCIHTYAENAIKHGFRNTKTGGVLAITVNPYKNKGVSISIVDNGMGRVAASVYKDSSGNGLNIMNDLYGLFEKYHGYKISSSVIDLNEPVGTQVELKIEIKGAV